MEWTAKKAKEYLRSHALDIIVIGCSAIIGAALGYHCWLIDLI
mgnify:FL=1